MRELTHLSLFSGIGGLDLAAEWAGIKTVGQCEWAEYPIKVLEKHWPDVPRWKDIRTLTKESFYERTGRRTVDVISGGFPCQPFSVAGKRRGKEDDRYLWPEMVRVIKELRPTWVVGENVAGIVRMALPGILSELEACGYRTRTFLIPACAVGARHRRYRVAIVAHTGHNVLSGWKNKKKSVKGPSCHESESRCSCGPVPGAIDGMENSGSGRCGQPGNVYKQPGRTESERSGEDLAYTKGQGKRGLSVQSRETAQKDTDPDGSSEDAQHAHGPGCEEQYASTESDKQGFFGGGCDERTICNASSKRLPDGTGEQMERSKTKQKFERSDSYVSDSDNRSGFVWRDRELPTIEETGREQCDFGNGEEEHEQREWRSVKSVLGGMADGISHWLDRDPGGEPDWNQIEEIWDLMKEDIAYLNGYWDIEPDIPRVAAGIPDRINRIKALGNAVVPQQFYPIFKAIRIIEQIIEMEEK